MTNGTSQGLFVVVAIIIFGIFVFISYLLFKDTLKPTLANIFTDGFEQTNCQFDTTKIKTIKCNPTFNNSFDFKIIKLQFSGYAGIFEAQKTDNSDILMIDINNRPEIQINQETNTVALDSLHLWDIKRDNSFTSENGYTKNDEISVLTLTVNQDKSLKYYNLDYFYGVGIGTTYKPTNYQPQLALNQINTFKIELENAYGGKTVKTIRVKIIHS